MKKHNFNPGPSILVPEVIKTTSNAVADFENTGLSVMEISHRSAEFSAVMKEAQELFRELLQIPDGYSVLFVGGGASLQFAMVPYNLLSSKAAYLNTGAWASKAVKEAGKFGEVIEVASSKDKNFSYIPKGYTIPADADYMHITTNNTIFGTEIKEDIESPIPLVADMSSDILSRPLDVSKYALIYGGAQKNLGPAGVTFVIIKDDVLGKVDRNIPTMLDYRTHIDKNSMFNTPPVLPIYVCLQTLKWLKANGGLEQINKVNALKARTLYEEIDRNPLFEPAVSRPEDRSIMNVCFVMNEEFTDREAAFLEYCSGKGIIGVKGHRSAGGFRASIYNGMPLESVSCLVRTMQEFAG